MRIKELLMKTRCTLIYSLLSAIVLLLAGCGGIAPTPIPPYIHYTPSKVSSVRLEFDYPSSWVITEETKDTNFMVIGLGDPRFRTLPTSDSFEHAPNDFGSIVIWIMPSKSYQTVEAELDLRKKEYNETDWMTVLDNYKIMIDGYVAGVLEYQIHPTEDFPSLMFNRRILFIVEDQIYEILFEIAEKDRGSEFEQGYEYFFNSLKILP